MLSIVAAGIYAVVVLTCFVAAVAALTKKQHYRHIIAWAAFGAFFAVLVYLRLNDFEEIWRDELRAMLRADGTYDGRRAFQLPLAAGVIIIIALAVLAWIVQVYRGARGRRNVAVAVAQLGVFLMLGMIALRMVSFSLVDKILYGPPKLNWVGDIGSAALVAGCSVYYIRIVLAPPRRRKQL